MERFGKVCVKIEEAIGGILLLMMLAFVFFGTVGRYTGLYNMFWSDEASRYCMIWMVFILAGLSAQRGQMFSVDLLSDKLSPKGQKFFAITRFVLMTVFCIFACYFGIDMIQRQIKMGQVSPSMKIPMWLMYSTVPVGMAILLVHYVVLTCQVITMINATQEEK